MRKGIRMEASEDNDNVVSENVGDEGAPVEVSHDPREDMKDKGVEAEGAEGNETKLCRVRERPPDHAAVPQMMGSTEACRPETVAPAELLIFFPPLAGVF